MILRQIKIELENVKETALVMVQQPPQVLPVLYEVKGEVLWVRPYPIYSHEEKGGIRQDRLTVGRLAALREAHPDVHVVARYKNAGAVCTCPVTDYFVKGVGTDTEHVRLKTFSV
jgi:hypothetical protein